MKQYLKLVNSIFFFIILCCTCVTCVSHQTLSRRSNQSKIVTKNAVSKTEPPVLHYYIFQNGLFVESEPNKKPVWKGGPDNIYPGMYQNIKYPAFAREHGIQGTVVITVTINEFGQMEDAYVSRNVGGGCDEEALRVVKEFGLQGFEPAQMNGLPVKVRYDYSLKFILQ
ncbi:MAG: energy transducer TonB [Saprospiraceae bacterium]